jgi:predicted hydrolase (HD superfamily)
MIPTREEANKILDRYVDNVNLKKHMYAVEAVMRALAYKYKEDPNKWGITGLLHDADWEKHPTEHPKVIVKELREMGVEEDICHAIAAHGNNSDEYGHDRFETRDNLLDKALFASDEISGFVVACALVRPDKMETLEARSVIKKMKDKKFAAQVSREDIKNGAEDLGIPLEEHITLVINTLKSIKEVFGF